MMMMINLLILSLAQEEQPHSAIRNKREKAWYPWGFPPPSSVSLLSSPTEWMNVIPMLGRFSDDRPTDDDDKFSTAESWGNLTMNRMIVFISFFPCIDVLERVHFITTYCWDRLKLLFMNHDDDALIVFSAAACSPPDWGEGRFGAEERIQVLRPDSRIMIIVIIEAMLESSSSFSFCTHHLYL